MKYLIKDSQVCFFQGFLQPALQLLTVMTVVLLVLSSVNARAQTVGIPIAVSINQSGDDTGNAASFSQSSMTTSLDGRYVVFSSAASDLVPNDTNGYRNVFVRDLEAGTTTLVSINNDVDANGGNGSSDEPVISSDGRLVAFRSTASNLVDTDTNGNWDVFVRDLDANTTTLVSVNSSGNDSGNGRSLAPSISADGLFVAFQSEATDIAAPDVDSTRDIFRRDLQKETTTLVSINTAGTASGNNDSFAIGINADGRYVVFVSDATDLVALDSNGQRDVFIRDLQEGATELVSVNYAGDDSANASSNTSRTVPIMSADGNFVTFRSSASDLVATDTNGTYDIFVRDRQNSITTLVSVNSTGADSGNGTSSNQALSSDGRLVAFDSVATDLIVPNVSGVGDVFVRDLQNDMTTLVSVNQTGFGGGNANSTLPVLSGDGRFVVFSSNATDLTTLSDSNGGLDTFVRDFQNNTTVLASVNPLLSVSGNGNSFGTTSISHDGRLVTFVSSANDLVAVDTNHNNANGVIQDLFAFISDSDGDGIPDADEPCNCAAKLLDSAKKKVLKAKEKIAAGSPGVNNKPKAVEKLNDAKTNLDSASEHLQTGDQNHLKDGSGTKFYNNKKMAIEKMSDAVTQGEISNVEILGEIEEIANEVFDAGIDVASAAVDDAVATSADPVEIDKAKVDIAVAKDEVEKAKRERKKHLRSDRKATTKLLHKEKVSLNNLKKAYDTASKAN